MFVLGRYLNNVCHVLFSSISEDNCVLTSLLGATLGSTLFMDATNDAHIVLCQLPEE